MESRVRATILYVKEFSIQRNPMKTKMKLAPLIAIAAALVGAASGSRT